MWNKNIISFIAGIILSIIAIATPNAAFANNPPDQGHSSLSTSNQAPANGSSTVNAQVTLQDSSGNPVTGDSVTFSTPNDSTAVFNPSSTTLNSSGQVSFTVTSTNPGTDNITVTDTTTNTTLADLGQVVFTSTSPTNTPTPTCSPVTTPVLTAASSNAPTQITLTWSDSSGSVNNYVLAYGTTSGKYIYGNPNIGGQGTTTYTVSSLTQGTTYYFAIQADNACSTSSFSNEMSAVAGGTQPTTATTSNTSSVSPAVESPTTQQVSPTSAANPSPVSFGSPTPDPGGSIFDSFNIWNVIVTILVLILLGVGGYFLYNRFIKKNGLKRRKWYQQNHEDDTSDSNDENP